MNRVRTQKPQTWLAVGSFGLLSGDVVVLLSMLVY